MSENIDWKAEAEKAEAGRLAGKQHFRTAVIRETVIAESRLLGGIDADLALKTIDESKILFDDETGEVLGVREAILEVALRWPGVFSPKVKRQQARTRNLELEAIHRELGMK